MPLISSRVPLLLAIVATLAMVAAFAWQGYRFWQDENASTRVPSVTTSRAENADPTTPTIDLASVPLFGDASNLKEAPEPNIDDLPETNLQLVLRGVMSASGDFPGSALVEDSERNTEAYIVGDELPGNATLRTVRPDRIVIERSGRLENLYFPEEEVRSDLAYAVNDNQPDPQSNREPEYVEQEARPASFSGPGNNTSSDARREEIRQRLEQLRNRLRNNN